MYNKTKKTQTILFAGLIAAMILPFSVMSMIQHTKHGLKNP